MAVADALISKVVDLLVSNFQQDFRLVAGVEEEVQKLTFNLQSIQAVLADAERRQWKEATTVQLWLARLKDIAYDIDDVVDEWTHEMLKSKIERDENDHNSTRKVWPSSLLSACYCFPRFVARRDVAVKISNLNKRLNGIAIEKDTYGFQSLRSNNENVERNITTSDIDMSEVKGRDVDKEKLVNMLLAGSNEMSNIRLITIVGMGGIGKTTLARLVYNDQRVKSHFHKRIWVCVSDPFDENRIAKEILEYLQGATNLVSFPNVMENIKESIKGKKILVVLDDVWNEDPKKWKQLEDCLKGDSLGITILVSTRNEIVGRIMGCLEFDIFRIGLLSEQDSWELFCMIAFHMKSGGERESLENMGREIVGRCKGLPLAIRAIAGLLRFKERRTEWQSVLDSQLWGMEEVYRDIVGPLWLSYYDLPSPLKQCFLYCAIFPKDTEIEKYKLVSHWIAQGYIKGSDSKDMEMIGEEYFQSLLMRSFLQDLEVRQNPYLVTKTVCKMHDIVHDFAQLQVKKECLSIEVNNDSETISLDESLGNLLRHLSIIFKDRVHYLDSFYDFKKLRSLILSSQVLDLRKIFSGYTLLRSLILSHCCIIEVPSNISRLIHLRELDLSHNDEIIELPCTLWKLYNLQILNLSGNYKMRSVKGIERLTNLRYLENSGTNFFLPIEMVRLRDLRRLNWVNVDVDNDDALSLKHLKNFNRLGGSLVIKWSKRRDGDVEDAMQARLIDKKHITGLQIHFGLEEAENSQEQDEELAEALNVPPSLEILHMHFYRGLRTPNWMDLLTFVKMLQLGNWWNCKHLPSLGKLPCLEDLQLWRFWRVKEVGYEFLGIDEMMFPSSSIIVPLFPKLKSLRLSYFHSWEAWKDADGEIEVMPSLTYLELYECPELKALPNFIVENTSLRLDFRLCHSLSNNIS